MLQFCYCPALLAVYPLIVPKIADITILYSLKVLKTFNPPLDHKRKLIKVTRNTLRIHFQRPHWSRILFPKLHTLGDGNIIIFNPIRFLYTFNKLST